MKIQKILKSLFIVSSLLLFANVSIAQTPPRPSVTITSPTEDQRFSVETVDIKLSVQNFVFVDFKNNTVLFPGNPNAGHAHMWIEPAPEGMKDVVYEVKSPDIQNLDALEKGSYTVTVELVQNNHEQFSPRVFETVSFKVDEPTVSGKYVVTSRESVETVGSEPHKLTGLFVTLGILAVLAVLIYVFRRRITKNRYFVPVVAKFKSWIRSGIEKYRRSRIYSRFRRIKQSKFGAILGKILGWALLFVVMTLKITFRALKWLYNWVIIRPGEMIYAKLRRKK